MELNVPNKDCRSLVVIFRVTRSHGSQHYIKGVNGIIKYVGIRIGRQKLTHSQFSLKQGRTETVRLDFWFSYSRKGAVRCLQLLFAIFHSLGIEGDHFLMETFSYGNAATCLKHC